MNPEFEKLCFQIKNLPYGRNANRSDFSLVLSEGKGTCSSKHAFLKQKADELGIPCVQLILGMYRMNNLNTPKIGNLLTDNGLSYIPEAHCYLKINNVRYDFTSSNSDFSRLSKDVLEEKEIIPAQVIDFKIEYHRKFMASWIALEKIPHTFNEIWTIREQCIQNLGQ